MKYKYVKKLIDPSDDAHYVDIPENAFNVRHEDYYAPLGVVKIEVSWFEPVEEADE
ncbi:MAG: hypothetical protein KAJ03_03640 [Gammaproteobacteria bacterium]|nr:hypothetical protein [Gammaproteobacteria bacterium]